MPVVTGSIVATYEPEDEEQPSADLRIWFSARGEFAPAQRGRHYHPNDPDGPEPAEVEFDSCDVIDRRGSPIAGAKATPEQEAWARGELARRSAEAEQIAWENSGPDPDEWYDRMRDDRDAGW